MGNKEVLRIEAKKNRDCMDLTDECPDSACNILFDNFKFTSDSKILLYWPIDREFDVFPIMDKLRELEIDFYLPVIVKDTRILKFAKFQGENRLEKSQYDIYQPIIDDNSILVDDVDYIMLPLLAFDMQGGRLGYGGGYYDATIDNLKSQGHNPVLIGVGYSKQACLFPLPKEDHDQKMDYVLTPKKIFKF